MAPRRVRKCCIRVCNKLNYDPSVTYHKFPTEESENAKWHTFIRMSSLNKTLKPRISKSALLCSRHFQSCCFYQYGKLRGVRIGHKPSTAIDHSGQLQSIQACRNDKSRLIEIEAMQLCLDIDITSDQNSLQLLNYEVLVKTLEAKLASTENIMRSLESQLSRRKEVVQSLQNIIKKLKSKNRTLIKKLGSNQHTKNITTPSQLQTKIPNPLAKSGSFGNIFSKLMTRAPKPKNTEFEPTYREFSVTLHYYSPKAYNFLRETVCPALPHPKSLSTWTSGIKASPGFLPDALQFLSDRNKISEEEIFYALTLDEVHIRKQVLFDGEQMRGFVDYGDIQIRKPNQREATNALFVMATEIVGHFKTPIGYILTNGCDAELVATVIKESLQTLYKNGVRN